MSEVKAKILVVDDSNDARTIMCNYLKREGYEVVESHSGESALERLAADSFDVVLMDHRMPGLSGLATISVLRKTHPKQVLPVIMVTAESDSRTIVAALEAGANDFILKPVDFPVLFARLDTQLELRAALERAERYRQNLEQIIDERTGELKAKERLLKTVFNNLPLPLYVKDTNHRFLMANPAMEAFHNVPPGGFIGRKAQDIESMEKEDAELVRAQDERVFRGEGIDLQGEAVNDGFGRPHILHIRKVPLRNHSNEVIGMVGLSEDITERNRAEQAQLASQKRISSIVNLTMDAIISVDDQSCITMFNQGAERIFGHSADSITGKPLDVLLPKNARKNHASHLRRFGESEETSRPMTERGIIYGQRKSGEIFPAEAAISKLMDHGKAIYTVTLRDITERQEAEANLRKSEEQFRNLVEGSIQGLYIQQEYKFVFANQTFASIIGFDSPEHLLSASPDQTGFMHPDDRERIMSYYKLRLVGKEAPARYEARWLRRDGSVIWLESAVRMIEWDGKPAAQATCVDITERKQAEENLRQSKLLLQTVFDTVPHWMFVKDVDARYLMVNKQFAEDFERQPEDFIGNTYGDMDRYSDESEVVNTNTLDRRLIETRTLTEAEYDIRQPNGQMTRRRVTKVPFTTEDGEITGLVGISEDITARDQAEQALRQAQKMEAVGELTSGVAHDFNNILQIVSGYTQMAAADKSLQEKTSEHLKKVLKATERASILTRQLLTFSRKSVIQLRLLDLNNAIADAEKMIRLIIGVNIELTLHPGDDLGVVSADPGMVEQVLLNLCINARDAMPDGGTIKITTSTMEADEAFIHTHAWRRTGHYVELDVTDSGTGMPPEVKDRIFEPFFTTKTSGKGTGLGLAMVYGIMQQHHGEIFVQSKPGEGTRFKLYFPVTPGQEQYRNPAPEAMAKGGTETILVVEDTPDVLALVVVLLEEKGYKVITASNGKEAVEVFKANKEKIDLLMLDVVLPNMSGREVFECINKLKPSIPVLFTSGFGGEFVDAEFMQRKAVTLIQKPYRPSDLFHAMRAALD